jgi:IPT/TIG domain
MPPFVFSMVGVRVQRMLIPLRRIRLLSTARWSAALLLILSIGGCAGSSQSPSGSPSSPGTPFQPRAFPGDYFIRLSPQTQNGRGEAAAEIYNPLLKEVFVSNPDNNAIEVFSSVDAHMVGEISIPGPAGLSFSPDYSSLVIGTITPYLYVASPVTLHITEQIQVPAAYLSGGPSFPTIMPVTPYAMADGTILIEMGVTDSSGNATAATHLVLYDPVNGTFAYEDPGGGSGISAIPARSGDGKSLVVTGSVNGTPDLFLYTTAAQGYVASASVPSNLGGSLAANADGSQFAAVLQMFAPGLSTTQVNFWGPNLQSQGQYTNAEESSGGGVFSRDGNYFYVMLANNRIAVLNAKTGTPVGYLGAVVGASATYSQLFDIDESSHLFGGPLFEGMFIVNASELQASPPAALPDFTTPGTEGSQTVGPTTGGALDRFEPAPENGGSDGIDSSMEAYFGATPSPQDMVDESNGPGQAYLTAVVPAASTPGPVSVLLTDASNDAVFLPDDFTYGPHLLRLGPNAVSADGGDNITIVGYGIDIGGPLASFSYPEQSVTLTAPAGTPGWADISIGSATIKRGVQYLKTSAQVKGSAYAFACYDPLRDLFYLTGSGNSVGVFNPQTQTFQTSMQSTSISSSSTLFGEALTPDDSKLLVSDPNDHAVIVFDLVGGTSAAVNVLLPSDPPIPLTDPMPVIAAANNRAFVSITPCLPNPVREINLIDLTVRARPDAAPAAASACPAYLLYPEYGGASADGSTIVYAGNENQLYGLSPAGAESVWRYDTASDTFTGPVQIGDTPWVEGYPSVDADGQVIALGQGTLDPRLLPLVPFEVGGLDSHLNETGSLLYAIENSPNNGEQWVVISDTHNGKPLLTIGLPASVSGWQRPLAIDPTGQKILVVTPAGVSYFELSVVPLAVGTVSPTEGQVGTGATVRGSGFVSATTVQIGGQDAPCSEVDSETLNCTIPHLPSGSAAMSLANPDGQTYTFENAFVVQ